MNSSRLLMKPALQHFGAIDVGSLLTPSSMKSDTDICELLSGASYVYIAAVVPKVYEVLKMQSMCS